MARKGRLPAGADADVVVCDPATIIERAIRASLTTSGPGRSRGHCGSPGNSGSNSGALDPFSVHNANFVSPA